MTGNSRFDIFLDFQEYHSGINHFSEIEDELEERKEGRKRWKRVRRDWPNGGRFIDREEE